MWETTELSADYEFYIKPNNNDLREKITLPIITILQIDEEHTAIYHSKVTAKNGMHTVMHQNFGNGPTRRVVYTDDLFLEDTNITEQIDGPSGLITKTRRIRASGSLKI